MKKSAKSALLVAAAVTAGATAYLWNGDLDQTSKSGFVTEAHAIIGRPLTPLSYAGVARRTVRRCAVGVYYC
jgi:hypothetical protein